MKLINSLLLLLLLACAPLSYGAGLGVFWAQIDAEDLGESDGLGINFNFRVDPSRSVDIRYSEFDDFDTSDSIGSYEITPIEAIYLIKLNPMSGLDPYLGAGVGYYLQEAEGADGNELDLDDEFGWMLVGGFTYAVSDSIHLFGEAVYRKVEGKVDGAELDIGGVDSDDADLDMAGIGFNAGIVIRW